MSFFRRSGNIERVYAGAMLRELGRYPAWPPGRLINLGDLGIYNNKTRKFDWQKTLAGLGVKFSRNKSKANDELFSSDQGTSVSLSAKAGLGRADCKFTKAGAVVCQTVGLTLEEIPDTVLYSNLVERVAGGEIDWDFNWRIVSRIFHAKTATVLVNHRSGGSISLETTKPVLLQAFNIADADLGVQVRSHQGGVWNYVAGEAPSPWFNVHRLQSIDGKILLHAD